MICHPTYSTEWQRSAYSVEKLGRKRVCPYLGDLVVAITGRKVRFFGPLPCVFGSIWPGGGKRVSADIIAWPSAVGFVQSPRAGTRRARRQSHEAVTDRDS